MRKYIPIPVLPDPIDIWTEKASSPDLPSRKRRCEDCAIEFYGEVVVELKKQPVSLQKNVARSWFCHNTPTHACKGAIDMFSANQCGETCGGVFANRPL